MQEFCRNAFCSKPSAGAQTMLSWRFASCLAEQMLKSLVFQALLLQGCDHVDGSGHPGLPGHLLPIMESGIQILDLRSMYEGQASLPTPLQEAPVHPEHLH